MNGAPSSFLFLRSLFFVVFAALFCLTGCSDPQETAVESLGELGYGFSVDDYLLAAEAGDIPAVRLFHEAGMEVDAVNGSGTTALMRAATGGRLELVELLLEDGADLGATNDRDRTPLMFAAEGGRVDVVRLMLTRGADASLRDREGWTALKLAAFQGRPGVVELLAGKVDEETLDQVLLVAAFKGDTAVIDQLLNYGAYINTRSPENLTPLMIAAQAGNLDAVKFLLQNRANPYAIDGNEHTAANLAEEAGHLAVSELLYDPASVLEVADNGGTSEDPLLEADPELAEAAITDALTALGGGEAPVSQAELVSMAAPEEPVDEVMPIRTGTRNKSRLASINGRVLGADVESAAPAFPVAALTPTDAPVPGSAPTPASPAESKSEERGSNPPAPASSSEIGMRNPVTALKMKDYREEPLPVMLKEVEAEAGIASVRVLSSRDSEPVKVEEGAVIPGTSLKLASMDAKFVSSKMGKGKLVDVSSILVEDTVSGAKHLLVKDVPGRSTDTYATLMLPGSPFEYVVKNGDVFQAVTGEEGEQDYEVLDVRPTQVVIRNVTTEEVITVERDGIAMR